MKIEVSYSKKKVIIDFEPEYLDSPAVILTVQETIELWTKLGELLYTLDGGKPE